MKNRRKHNFLKRTDHRLDMSPMGRNLFVSQDKQAQSRAARRIEMWMKVVVGLVVTALVVGVVLFVMLYLIPFFRMEFQIGEGTTSSSEVSSMPEEASALPIYDDMGLTVYSDEVNLFVINEGNPGEEDFSPELVEVSGVQVDFRIAEALRVMVAGAKADGLSLTFTEGYVSYEEQQKRFEERVEELMEGPDALSTVMARSAAKETDPMGGQSDFQTGMCLRLVGNPETFEDSQTYSWLKANMGKYGFVFRYPEYKEDYTGLLPDPTVIRYVGSANASAMLQRSMCLEEYISYLNRQ